MSRRRSASLSRPAFVDPALDFSPDVALDALALAGRDGPPLSRSRSNSLAGDELATLGLATGLHVELTLTQACEVEIIPSRPFVKVRKAAPSSSSTTSSRLSAGRPTPKRAMTRMVPEEVKDSNVNPLESAGFREGLRKAGYLAPIDTSRKAIKGRFVHGLEKEEFKAHLDSFLEDKALKSRGEYMVRFQDVHSPFVHLFLTTLPSDTTTVKLFADGPDVKKPGVPTTWTYLPQDNPDESHWACKAKSFWPARVCFEGPKATDIVPGTAPVEDDRRARRRKRRDTFQQEVDIDEVAKQQEAEEEQALKDNTHLNSLHPGEAPILKLDTSGKKSSSSSKKTKQPAEEEEQVSSPLTPTILASAKQLGQSIVTTVQPAVQHRIEDLKNWWSQQQTAQAEEPEFFDEDEEERRRRKERRRRRRERRAREEAEEQAMRAGRPTEDEIETAEVERMAREEEQLEKEERRRRRAERRRREAEFLDE